MSYVNDSVKKQLYLTNAKYVPSIFWQVSEDEIIVSDCGLQDMSIAPFLDALRSHKTIAVLDLSHNLLGSLFPVITVISFHNYFNSAL